MIHERNPRHFRARHFDRTREIDFRAFKKLGLIGVPRTNQENHSTTLFLSDGIMYNVPSSSGNIYTEGELMGMTDSLAGVAKRIESVRDRLAQQKSTNAVCFNLLEPHHAMPPSQN